MHEKIKVSKLLTCVLVPAIGEWRLADFLVCNDVCDFFLILIIETTPGDRISDMFRITGSVTEYSVADAGT